MTRPLAVLAALALIVAACGDSATTTTAVPPAADTTTTTAPTTSVTTTVTTAAPTTTAATTTTTTTTDWIGEPYDFWVPVPDEGAIIGVIGVRYDDTLNVRTGPGIDFDVIAELDPTLMGITGTGAGWQLPSGSVWWEIEIDGVTGWANQRFLSRIGDVDDVTALIVERLGQIPTAATMLDLANTVGNEFVFEEDGTLVVTVAPTEGDLGEVTVDVVGVGDDSVGGQRLHIFGQPNEGAGFSLMTVEATIFCQRGVSGGVCV